MPAPESRLRIAVASLSGTPTSMAFFSENVVRSSGRRYLFTLSASVTAAIVSASSPRPTSSQHRRMNSAREPCDAGAAPSRLPASGGNNGGADVGLARSTPSAVERHRGVDARVVALDARLTVSKITRRITNHPASLAHRWSAPAGGERQTFITPASDEAPTLSCVHEAVTRPIFKPSADAFFEPSSVQPTSLPASQRRAR